MQSGYDEPKISRSVAIVPFCHNQFRCISGHTEFDFPAVQNLSISRPIVNQRLKSRFFIPAASTPRATCVAISAAEGTGLDDLLQRVQEMLEEDLVPVHVLLPYSSDGLLGLFHQRGVVEREEYSEAGVTIQGRVPEGVAQRFERYLIGEQH